MKKYLILLLLQLLPFSAIAGEKTEKVGEHGGTAVKAKSHASTESAHAGQAAKKKVPGLTESNHAASADEHAGKAVKKKTDEHAGEALK